MNTFGLTVQKIHSCSTSFNSSSWESFIRGRFSPHLQKINSRPITGRSARKRKLPNLWERHLRCHRLDVIPWLLWSGITLLFGCWMHRRPLAAPRCRAEPVSHGAERHERSVFGTGRRHYNGYVQFLPAPGIHLFGSRVHSRLLTLRLAGGASGNDCSHHHKLIFH